MKVRIGYSAGAGGPLDGQAFAAFVDDLERLRFDSLWIPEVLGGATVDPLTALAIAAGRTMKLKLGTHLIAPGRQPARLAKELATLDQLSGGRLLLTFVIGLPSESEISAGGVPRADRTPMLEELVPLVRRLLAGETVTHSGRFYELTDVHVEPRPVQEPLEIWFGGAVPAALRRCGRLAEGWMPGLTTPAAAGEARRVILDAAAEAGNEIDLEHFGANVSYSLTALDEATTAAVASRARDATVEELVPVGPAALVDRLGEFVDAGFSKFVLRPVQAAPSWREELEATAQVALPLQT